MPAGPPLGWTAGQWATLERMWGEGASTVAIATVLGKTKNAVVGVAHRHGLPGRPSPIRRRTEGAPSPARTPRPRFLPPPPAEGLAVDAR